MSGILVGKHINGIPLNGLEYLLDEGGVEAMRFQSEAVAKAFCENTDSQKNTWKISGLSGRTTGKGKD